MQCDVCQRSLVGHRCAHCEERQARPWIRVLEGFLGAIGVGIIVYYFALEMPIELPLFHGHRRQGLATACKSNLKNIGTALEMYSTDNGGHFPHVLTPLTPIYLTRIPSCPSVGMNTYSVGYVAAMRPNDAYTLVCAGLRHRNVGFSANYPQYTSQQGLLER